MDRNALRDALEKKLRVAATPWERLPILIELTGEPTHNDPHYARQCAQEALALAKSLNDQFWTGQSLYAIGILSLSGFRYSETIQHLQRASDIFRRINNLHMKVKCDLYIARTYTFMGKFDKALPLLIRCRAVFRNIGDIKFLVRTLTSTAETYKGMGDHGRGLKYCQRALRVATRAQLESEFGSIYHNLAFTYRQIGDQDRARVYLLKSLTVYRRYDIKSGVAIAMGNLAQIDIERSLLTQAEMYVRRSGRIYRELGYVACEAISWSRLVTIYSHNNNFARAAFCFRKGLALARNCEDQPASGQLYRQFGAALLREGKTEQGIACLNRALAAMRQSGYAHYQFEVHQDLAEAYERAGNPAKALEHQKEHNRIKEEYVSAGKVFSASRTVMRAKIRALAERLKQERSRSTSLRGIVEEKEAELVALTLQLVQQGSHREKEVRAAARPQAAVPGDQESSWDTFARQFHTVHHSFHADLVRRYPQLTPTEVKVCSLIRIGLSSKEIASILHISKRTVDSHREHIQKKLNIQSRLATFIAGI